MAERANVESEKNRMFDLRMAEFFAAWGSSPGNSIVAGLNALKTKIPDIISDTKEAAKVRRDIDKSIAEVGRAERLEKSGNYDAAQKLILDQAKIARETWAAKLKYFSEREHDKTLREIASIKAEGAGGAGGEKLIAKVEKDISDEKKGDVYKNAYKWANMTLPKDASQMMKDKVANAKAELQKFEADFERRRQRAKTGEDTTPAAAAAASAPNVIRYNAQGERI